MSDASNNGIGEFGTTPSLDSSAALFEHAPRPMAAVGDEGSPRVLVVNRAYLDRFDSRRVEDGNRRQIDRDVQLAGTERRVVRTATSNGAPASDTLTKQTPDGLRVFTVRAIPAPQSEVTAYLQYRDVTTRRIRDQQLAVLKRILRHDLRNDLTVLLGYAETIAETAEDPRVRGQAATMIEAASDLHTVANSAGRMQRVTESADATPLPDVAARAMRSVTSNSHDEFTIDGPVPSRSVDGRIGIAVEELCRTLCERDEATEIELSIDAAEGWATVTFLADGDLSDQERAALEGRDETKLRHATGMASWIARWATRAAGGRLRVDERGRAGCRVTVTAPTLEATAVNGPEPTQLDD